MHHAGDVCTEHFEYLVALLLLNVPFKEPMTFSGRAGLYREGVIFGWTFAFKKCSGFLTDWILCSEIFWSMKIK